MSVSSPATRAEFKNWCLRDLGAPVIVINVDSTQVDDRIEEALEYFQRNHYDGSMTVYLPVAATAETELNGYFKVDDSILTIMRVLQFSGIASSTADITLDPAWQSMANAAMNAGGCAGCGMCGGGMSGYASYMMNRDLLRSVLGGNATPMEWRRHTDRLYIHGNPGMTKEGKIVVVEAQRVLDPEEFPQVWNDPFLKRYCAALIKRQWGNNLRKLRNVPLAGGAMIQGEEILAEAVEELQTLRDEMESMHSFPPLPLVG